MPSKNVIRHYDSDAYYHIYNRGVEKRDIFLDEEDYGVFLSLLKRHMDDKPHQDKSGRQYEQFKDIELLAFCLMPNHFHLFIFQGDDAQAFTKLMQRISTSYTMYFNRKYNRVGHLFQERFKASRITSDDYLQHVSRYIHLNPREPFSYKWSSLPYYEGKLQAAWLKPQKAMAQFNNFKDYQQFLKDYQGQKKILDELKRELADH